MSSKLSGTFTFVLIPADENQPIQEIQQDKSGGLTNDQLIAHARAYFGEENQICDISALTIPTSQNNYTAVSLYTAGGDVLNPRATKLVVGCGMDTTVNGNVFVGRCIDNEPGDIWERVDFTIADVDPSSDWCKLARSSSSGSSSRSSPTSLSSILQQQMQGGQGTTMVNATETTDTFGTNGTCVTESWGSWSQTKDEVELKLVVPQGTKSKDVKIHFQRTHLSIQVHGVELVEGTTFDPIIVDDCTYTIQNEGPAQQREVCVSLAKANSRVTWSYTVQ
jgi:hypothetical protein